MNQNQKDNLEKILKKFIERKVTIKQDGFLKNQYTIQKFQYQIQYEIINIKDENSTNYLSINLNQIYKTEINEENIILYLDNDTIIYFFYNK